jgi:hypothetical protein
VLSRAALGVVLLLAALPAAAGPSATPGGWSSFTANWTASGHEHTLVMGERRAATVELAGPFVVTRGDGLGRGFFARAIGFVDGGALGIGRMVLTDESGDQIFNDLEGQGLGNGKQIRGTITGGTGRYAGIEGNFVFDWRYVLQGEDGTIQGRTVGLSGRYRRDPSAAGTAEPHG